MKYFLLILIIAPELFGQAPNANQFLNGLLGLGGQCPSAQVMGPDGTQGWIVEPSCEAREKKRLDAELLQRNKEAVDLYKQVQETEKQCLKEVNRDKKTLDSALGACKAIGASNTQSCMTIINNCLSNASAKSSFCNRASKARQLKDIEDRIDDLQSDYEDQRERVESLMEQQQQSIVSNQNQQLELKTEMQNLQTQIQEAGIKAQDAQAQAAQQANQAQAAASAQIAKFQGDIQRINAKIRKIMTADRAGSIAKFALEYDTKRNECLKAWEDSGAKLQEKKNALVRAGKHRLSSVGKLISQKQTRDDGYIKRRFQRCTARIESLMRLFMAADEARMKAEIDELKAEIVALNSQISSAKQIATQAKDAAQQAAGTAAQLATMQIQSMGAQFALLAQKQQNMQHAFAMEQKMLTDKFNRANFEAGEAERKYRSDARTADSLRKQGITANEVEDANRALDNAKNAVERWDSIESNIFETLSGGYNCKVEANKARQEITDYKNKIGSL